MKKSLIAILILTAFISACSKEKAISIQEQGSFAIGGSYVTHEGVYKEENFISPEGQRAYGDHAYVFYQKPTNTKRYPLIFQHGGAQSKRTWETTPDGRDGFQNIFLKKGYSVYLLDQPRSGEASLSTEGLTPETPWASNPMYGDKTFYLLSRVGKYDKNGNPIPNAQFPEGEENYEAFQRSWTVGSGPLDNDLNAKVLAELVDKVGESILVTHSMGGTIGWRAVFDTDKIKAIIAYEPGGTPFIFPERDMPDLIKAKFEHLSATALEVPMEKFKKLTEIPIILYYGDYIPNEASNEVGPDKWRTEFEMAKKFVATINKYGGDATIVHLPEIGIEGNSHFLMAEKNNKQLADLAENWLKEKGLNK